MEFHYSKLELDEDIVHAHTKVWENMNKARVAEAVRGLIQEKHVSFPPKAEEEHLVRR